MDETQELIKEYCIEQCTTEKDSVKCLHCRVRAVMGYTFSDWDFNEALQSSTSDALQVPKDGGN